MSDHNDISPNRASSPLRPKNIFRLIRSQPLDSEHVSERVPLDFGYISPISPTLDSTDDVDAHPKVFSFPQEPISPISLKEKDEEIKKLQKINAELEKNLESKNIELGKALEDNDRLVEDYEAELQELQHDLENKDIELEELKEKLGRQEERAKCLMDALDGYNAVAKNLQYAISIAEEEK